MLLAGRLHSKVLVGQRRGYPSALRAVEQPELHQVGFVDFLDGVLFFAKRGGNRV